MCIQGGCVILHRTRIRDYSGSTVRWVLEGKMTGVVIEKSPRFVMKTHHPRSCATLSPWGLPASDATSALDSCESRSPRQGLAGPATSSPAASHHSPHA
ncbi:hypothetical protein EV121DRAFT_280859 [Schizophyllum commune]